MTENAWKQVFYTLAALMVVLAGGLSFKASKGVHNELLIIRAVDVDRTSIF